MGPIYLDHASTTPVLPEVGEAMRPFFAASFGNAASAHAFGRRARVALEDARERVAALLDAFPDEVIFTSGATEANNLALFGLAGDPPGHLLASPVEHPCVVEPLRLLAARGFELEWLPVDGHGLVPADAVQERLRPDTRLVSVMLVNHETGAKKGSGVFSRREKTPDPFFHTDAAQAVGKVTVSFRDLGVDALTVSAHKFNGPQGVGALLLKRGRNLRPLLHGGHQQQGRRPGTEPVALAVGMATALDLAVRYLDERFAAVKRLRDRLLGRLRESAAPVVVNGPDDGSPYVLNVSFPGCRGDLLVMALDLAGVACSTGSACSSGSLLPSPVLRAMGVPDDVLRSALRFGLSHLSSEAEIDEAVRRIADAVRRARADDDFPPQGGGFPPQGGGR